MGYFTEKRRFERIPVHIKVKKELDDFDFGFSYAKNLSVDGMLLDTKIVLDKEDHLKTGDILKLKFKLPCGRFFIETKAVILRVEGVASPQIAVQFKNLDGKFVTDIEEFIKRESL